MVYVVVAVAIVVEDWSVVVNKWVLDTEEETWCS